MSEPKIQDRVGRTHQWWQRHNLAARMTCNESRGGGSGSTADKPSNPINYLLLLRNPIMGPSKRLRKICLAVKMTASSWPRASTLPIGMKGEYHNPKPEKSCVWWPVGYITLLCYYPMMRRSRRSGRDWEGWIAGSKRQNYRAVWEILCQKFIEWIMSSITAPKKTKIDDLQFKIQRWFEMSNFRPSRRSHLFACHLVELGCGTNSARTMFLLFTWNNNPNFTCLQETVSYNEIGE